MKRKHFQRISLGKRSFASRRAELSAALVELSTMSDGAAAAALNERGIPALGGGEFSAMQIWRLRKQLNDEKQHAPVGKIFNDVQEDMLAHLSETEELLVSHQKIAEHIAELATVLKGWSFNLHYAGIEDTSAQEGRRYLRLVRQLEAALAYVSAIVPQFEQRQASRDCASKHFDFGRETRCYARCILADALKRTVPEVEARLGVRRNAPANISASIEADTKPAA
jgi:hypothetical protein